MAGKKKESNQKLTNYKRFHVMKKYLSPVEITKEDESTAIGELMNHETGIDTLYNFAYKEHFELGKPISSVIKRLQITYSLTALSSQYLMKNLTDEVSGCVNAVVEFNQNLTVINTNIAKLSGYLSSIEDEGSNTDIDVASLFSELRQWLSLKANIINQAAANGIQNKGLEIEKEKVDTLKDLSNSELNDMIKKLGE